MAFSLLLNIFQLVLFRKRLRYLTETTGKGGNITELDKEIIRVLKDEKDVSDIVDILGSSGHSIKKTKGMSFLFYLIFLQTDVYQQRVTLGCQ